jgi:hypothetical protein
MSLDEKTDYLLVEDEKKKIAKKDIKKKSSLFKKLFEAKK